MLEHKCRDIQIPSSARLCAARTEDSQGRGERHFVVNKSRINFSRKVDPCYPHGFTRAASSSSSRIKSTSSSVLSGQFEASKLYVFRVTYTETQAGIMKGTRTSSSSSAVTALRGIFAFHVIKWNINPDSKPSLPNPEPRKRVHTVSRPPPAISQNYKRLCYRR